MPISGIQRESANMATTKVSVTFTSDLHQEEYESLSASMTEDGELWLTDSNERIMYIFTADEWSAFAVTKEGN